MRRRPAGSVAGHAPKGEKDYWVVGINKKIYRRSRLVWVYHHGDIPDGLVIDHINRNRQDDRIENLRLVTRRQNQRNLSNQSKYGVGVYLGRCASGNPRQRYSSSISKKGKYIFLGTFATPEEAREAYNKASKEE